MMSETTPTEPMTTTERWQAEQAHRATPEGAAEWAARQQAERDGQVEKNLRAQWGGDESGFRRAQAAIELANTRLGITSDQSAQLERLIGKEGAAELARETGEALAMIDPETTPAEAREIMRELRTDRSFLARLDAGDRRAIKEWDALNTIAAFGGR